MARPVVAIAGAGDLARYLVEACQKADIPVHVINRAPREWFISRGVKMHVSDYTEKSLLGILNEVKATVLVSLINDANPTFIIPAQMAMLKACQASISCKRFIPSEFGGDVKALPDLPLFFGPTRIPVREALAKQTEVEYTLLCLGWYADYWHLPADPNAEWKSHMKDLRPVWPVDPTKRTIRVNGDGSAPVTFTAARDVADAMVDLFKAPSWEPYIYLGGETTTWSELARRVAGLYGVPFVVENHSLEDIQGVIAREEASLKDDPNHSSEALWSAHMDQWSALGGAGIPTDKIKAHRAKYFPNLTFMTIQDVVDRGSKLQGSEEVL